MCFAIANKDGRKIDTYMIQTIMEIVAILELAIILKILLHEIFYQNIFCFLIYGCSVVESTTSSKPSKFLIFNEHGYVIWALNRLTFEGFQIFRNKNYVW